MPFRVSEASGEIRLTVNNRKKRVVMSKMIESESDLDKVLSECSRIFVLFYASWCPFSQRFLPIFEKHTKNDEKDFCRVLTDEIESCEEDYSIDVVPTVIFFKNGKIAKRLDGIAGIGLNEKQFVEDDLVVLLGKVQHSKYEVGKHIGIISYNETPWKEFILNGITTISTDFKKMGELTAQMILNLEKNHIEVPFSVTLRKSL